MISADAFFAFNDQLLSLSERLAAGGEPGWGFSPKREIPTIVDRMRARLNRGEDLTQALDAEKGSWPPAYFRLFEAGRFLDSLPAGLEAKAELIAEEVRCTKSAVSGAIYPLVLLALGLVFFAIHCAYSIPSIVAAMESQRIAPDPLLAVLARVGTWSPIWLPILLIPTGACCLLACASISQRSYVPLSWAKWFPSCRRSWQLRYWSLWSRLASQFMAKGMPSQDALCEARQVLLPRSRTLIDSTSNDSIPRLLRWSLESQPADASAKRLALASRLYAECIDQVLDRGTKFWSTVVRVVFGGLLVGALGVAVFLPFVRFLLKLAAMHAEGGL